MQNLQDIFHPGQRWLSAAESELGLGMIVGSEHRRVEVFFPGAGESRLYAQTDAPLNRVIFRAGDSIQHQDGWALHIEKTEEAEGLVFYTDTKDDGSEACFAETQLHYQINLDQPSQRLLSGQADKLNWFRLRYQSFHYSNNLARQPQHGLLGARVSLLPHQMHIAHEIGNRYAPRVLLADEVGLGKTIEAGLVMHQQLITGRAQRILCVVPESLVHQWLVELLRRFNCQFSVFNEDRCDAIGEHAPDTNPFQTEQLVLCSLQWLVSHEQRWQQAVAAEWDLLTVDEAHHLAWSPEAPSQEYQIVEALAKATKGVLLLTATPEQLGHASHFARLRLLDPQRFHDFDFFVNEEKEYEIIAAAANVLMSDKALDDTTMLTLSEQLSIKGNAELSDLFEDAMPAPAIPLDQGDIDIDDLDESDPENTNPVDKSFYARQKLLSILLDQHGTSRVIFRNTRAAMKDFPVRKLIPNPLPLPNCYLPEQMSSPTIEDLIHPETNSSNWDTWLQQDPRVEYVIGLIKKTRGKLLIICACATTAMQLEDYLRLRQGLRTTVFHEDLSIIERDRAAAYFADPDQGAKALICSEIGSEGRNFQFAHHMVLFDLPLNPDLLEQRIGRLDRIGQSSDIRIHVPYFQNSDQEILFRWYQEGLNAFEQSCACGSLVFEQMESNILTALKASANEKEALVSELIPQTQALRKQLNTKLENGRDRLLEINSSGKLSDLRFIAEIKAQESTVALKRYLDLVFDCYGIDCDDHSEDSWIIKPGNHMLIDGFPSLPEDGCTITTNREIALSREEMQFVTWEHPLVRGAFDLVQSQELGNACVAVLRNKSVKPGTVLVETFYRILCTAPKSLQAPRYLPATYLRILLDEKGQNLADKVNFEVIDLQLKDLPKGTVKQLLQNQRDSLEITIRNADNIAQETLSTVIEQATQTMASALDDEINRLLALQRNNANIRDEEIQFIKNQNSQLHTYLQEATINLEAVRVIFTA